jgi:multidrug efflux system outer membrane protein
VIAYRTDRAARDKIARTIRSGEDALYLARDSYRNGLSNFLQVLDAERTLVQSRQQLFQADVTLTDDVIALYNALGGAWQETAVTKQRAVDRPVHAVRARRARQRRAIQPQ